MATLQEQLHFIQQKQKMRFKERILPREVDKHNDLDLKTVTERADLSQQPENEMETVDVEFLHSQIEVLQLESSQLKTKLKQTELKLVQLSRTHEEERMAMGGANSTVTQRIVYLSKKNRELNAEIASERNKVRELQTELTKSEAEIAKNSQTQSRSQENTSESELKINQLKDQLQAANQKKAEYRNEYQILKQELKVAHKVISKEVGEGASVAGLLKTGSGWRGRSQQIIALQNKVTELQQRLNDTDRLKNHSGISIKGTIDHRQASMLKKIEDAKKQTLEQIQNELALLTVEHSKLQHQFSALKSRNKILTAELKSLKSGSFQPPTPQLQVSSQPTSNEPKPDYDKITILEQRNRKLQTQLTKCLGEIQSLKEKRPSSPIKQPKSAPLPPLIVGSRGCTRAVHKKMASVRQLYSNVEENTLSQVNEAEKERLYGLTLSLQQRLDTCNDKIVSVETELVNLRQKHSNNKDKAKKTAPTGDLLEERMEILQNENEVLKATLEATRQEKLTDIQTLQELFRDTKTMFVDSVRQLCVNNTS